MKRHKLLTLGTLGIFALGFIMGCSKSSDQKVIDAQENAIQAQQQADVAVAENLAWKDWQSFKADVQAKIDANDNTIKAYKTRMTDSNGKMNANYNKNIDALQAKNKALRDRLNNYKDDGQTSWEIFARGFKTDMDELGTALKGFTN